jgi:hypothetical protein
MNDEKTKKLFEELVEIKKKELELKERKQKKEQADYIFRLRLLMLYAFLRCM